MLWLVLVVTLVILLLILLANNHKLTVVHVDTRASNKTWYFAGPLFSLQQITGNDKLVEAIERLSEGRYKFIVPQRLKQEQHNDATVIRQQDLSAVSNADGILVNFNGSDLDDGTIVEFVVSKSLNKPAVVLRTDFRIFTDTLNINPMLLGFPRTEYLTIDSLGLYQSLNKDSDQLVNNIALQIITAMDKATNTTSLVTPDIQFLGNMYTKQVLNIK